MPTRHDYGHLGESDASLEGWVIAVSNGRTLLGLPFVVSGAAENKGSGGAQEGPGGAMGARMGLGPVYEL